MFFGHLSINYLRNKREFLEPFIRNHFDIFLVSETKLDSSFPESELRISGYRLFRKDRNQCGGGLIFYVNEDIPYKTINTFNFPNSLEVLPLEINLRNKKILISCHKPASLNDEYFLDQLHGAFSFYSTTYGNLFLLGDFKISRDDELLKEFCNSFSLGHLIKTPTSYMVTNPSSIDHIITNMTPLFMRSCTAETGICDYHKLIMPFCRLTFAKGKSNKFFYRCYKNFDSKLFEETLIKNLSETELSLKSFETSFSLTHEKFEPLKQKYLRYNNSPFMNKTLRKAIMTGSKLQWRCNLDRTIINSEKYNKQRNICVNLLRKSKKQYPNKIDVKNITENKKFWKTIRPETANCKCKTANTIICS